MTVRRSSLKTSILLSSAGVFGAAVFWLLSFKAVAWWMGPAGVGLFSQLRQMAQAATIGATFGGTISVVQGLSECREDFERLQFRVMAARIVGAAGVGVVLLMLVLAQPITRFFLSSEAPDVVATVRWIALAVLLNVVGTYAMAVLNGYRRFHYLAVAQIAGPAALVLVLAGFWAGEVPPGPQLLAWTFILCFGVTAVVAALGMRRLPKLPAAEDSGPVGKAESGDFFRFALSNVISALSSMAALLLIRSWVIEARGLAFAGLFDAGWTLTFNYTTLLLTACSAVYLPALTAASQPDRQKSLMLKTAYLVLGVSILICYAMALWKELLIELLYSPQFQSAGPVVTVLAIAVVFRGISWVYGTMLLATRNARVLLVSDVCLNLALLLTTHYALDQSPSLEALGWAFVLPHFLYLVFVLEYALTRNSLLRRRHIWPLVIGATAPLMGLALISAGSFGSAAERVQVMCLGTGLVVGGAAFHAYRKVAL